MILRIRHRGIHKGKMRGPLKMLMIGIGWGARYFYSTGVVRIVFGVSIAWWAPEIDDFRIVTPFGFAPYLWTGREERQ